MTNNIILFAGVDRESNRELAKYTKNLINAKFIKFNLIKPQKINKFLKRITSIDLKLPETYYNQLVSDYYGNAQFAGSLSRAIWNNNIIERNIDKRDIVLEGSIYSTLAFNKAKGNDKLVETFIYSQDYPFIEPNVIFYSKPKNSQYKNSFWKLVDTKYLEMFTEKDNICFLNNVNDKNYLEYIIKKNLF